MRQLTVTIYAFYSVMFSKLPMRQLTSIKQDLADARDF